MAKLSALILFSLILNFPVWAQNKVDSPVGTWTNENKEARFEIFNCGEKLCGKIIWLKEPMRNGKPKMDANNPNEKLKNRPILGMVFLQDFNSVGNNKWENGTIYDPKSGKTYSCYLKLIDRTTLEVKGYIGISLIGRSQIWTRIP